MNLRRKTAAGIVWVGISSYSVQLFGLLVSILLARLLAPRDFGLLTLAAVVISLSNIFTDLGFGGTLVQFPEVDQPTADTAFTLNLGLSILLGAAVIGASGLVAGLFHEPQLSPLLKVLALSIVLAGARVVPSNLLERELQFSRKFLAEATPPLFYGLVAIGGALAGWGVWSLAAGTVAAALAQTALIWRVSSYRPALRFDRAIARRLWRFGQHLVYASLLLFLAANLDQVYIGRFIDVAQVGFYGLALSLGNLSTDYVANLFGRVLSPAFARVQTEPARLQSAYLASLRYIAYLAFPICAGIFVSAPLAVTVVYGGKWAASIPLIRVLCFYGLFRALGRLAGTYFTAVGKPAVSVRIILVRVVLLALLIFPLGGRSGAGGVAVALAISMALSVLWSIGLLNADLHIPARQLILELLPQAAAAALMGLAVAWLAGRLPVTLPALLLLVAAGAGLYALLILGAGGRRARQDLVDGYRLLARRGAPAEAPPPTAIPAREEERP